ncbi:MAG: hypothetical protein ACTH2Q_06410 [Propionibacteriaceae bacterium]
MRTSTVVILILLAVCLVGGIVVLVDRLRRRRWAGEAEDLGWSHEEQGGVERAAAFAHPPFDIGLSRDVDEVLTGRTSTGTSFQSFRYAYDLGAGPGVRVRVAMLELPFGLPEFYVGTRTATSRGAHLPEVVVTPDHAAQIQVRTADPDFAHAALPPRAWSLLAAWAATAPLDLSFDGAWLVAVNVPEDPDELAEVLGRLDAVRVAINPESLQAWAVPVKQPRLGFRGRDWVWSAQDDGLHTTFSEATDYTTSGFAHEAKNVIRGTAHGLPLVAFTHTWGNISRSPQPDTEHLVALHLPVSVPDLRLTRKDFAESFGFDGPAIATGQPAFDRLFTVRADDTRYAHDVLSGQLDFLLQAQAPSITLTGDRAIAWPDRLTEPGVVACADVLATFLRQIPTRVWTALGARPPLPPHP